MNSSGGYQTPWFDGEAGTAQDRGAAMIAAADALDAGPYEGFRQDQNLMMARLFESQPVASMFMYAGRYFGQTASSYTSFSLDDASVWNVLRSVCMTAASLVGRSRPRAQFVTTGGDVQAKRRSEQGTKWCDGWAAKERLYETTFEILVDCLRFDFGCLQVYEDNGKVCCQRILPSEVRADPLDALYGKPRTVYRRRFVSKHSVIMKCRRLAKTGQLPKGVKLPELEATVKAAETIDPIGVDMVSGLLRVEEAWHRRTTAEDDDGYHVIAIKGATIFEEKWKKDYIPLVFLQWERATTGMGGISLAMQLEPMQSWLNRLLARTERGQKLMCVPRLLIPRGSKVVKGSISNLVAGGIEYTGNVPPSAVQWPGMGQEIYQFMETLVQKMYDLPGINRNAAQGEKEAGTESGEAIRESIDIQQTRLQVFNQNWEQLHVNIFEIAIDMVTDIVNRDVKVEGAEKGKDTVGKPMGYVVDVDNDGVLERLDWKELDLDINECKVTVYPVNQLPATPQGRLDFIKDMLSAGLWDMNRARAAFDDLDTGSASDLEDAVFDLISQHFEDMAYDGIPHFPGPVQLGNFDLTTRLGMQYLAEGELKKSPRKEPGPRAALPPGPPGGPRQAGGSQRPARAQRAASPRPPWRRRPAVTAASCVHAGCRGGPVKTPGVRVVQYTPGVVGARERFVPMPNPPTGRRFAHWRDDRRARLGVKYGVMVDDPEFKRVLRNARKKERQG